MTDILDRKIKGLVAELVDAAPVAPPLGSVPARPRRAPGRWAAAAAAAACLVAAAAFLVTLDRSQGSRVQLGGRPPVAPALEDTEKPTFVVPAQLPAGLELVDAGSGTSGRASFEEIVFWSDDFTAIGRILWGPVEGGCPAAANPGVVPASQQEAIGAHRSAVPAPASGQSIQWCDPADGVMVTVSPGRLSREGTAEIAEGVVRSGDDLAVRLPARFTAVRTPAELERFRLRYRGHGPGAPELWVDVQSAGPFPLERQRVDSADPASWAPVLLGGRPAIAGDHVVAVAYDDHTLVVLSSPSLPESDLLAAAASLVPGDASLPKPVASDPGLCDRLGMCG
jgi:hypothetical protein